MPTTAASTGQSFSPDAMRAELPLTISTVSPTPASTVSIATRYVPSGLPAGSIARATSSLLLSSRSSLRVATTVPTMRARSMRGYALRLRAAGFADGQDVFEIRVRARNDMHRDQLADAPRRGRAGIRSGFDRRDVAAHDGRHIARANLFPTHQAHLGGLDHGIGGLNHGHQALGLDHPERFAHRESNLSGGGPCAPPSSVARGAPLPRAAPSHLSGRTCSP